MRTKGRCIALASGILALVILAPAVWLSWPQIRFRWLFEPLGVNTQGFPEYRHRKTGIVMVKLPGGKFWMGAQKTDPKGQNYDPEAEDNEGPVHEVTLSPFMIGKYEITQAQWKAVMGSNPSQFKGDDLPVEQVSWKNIQEFVKRTGLCLPTDTEWEYACQGGSTVSIGETREQRKNDAPGGEEGAANRFGIHDMHGNVEEWCADMDDGTGNEIRIEGFLVHGIGGGSWIGDAKAGMESDLGFRIAWRFPK